MKRMVCMGLAVLTGTLGLLLVAEMASPSAADNRVRDSTEVPQQVRTAASEFDAAVPAQLRSSGLRLEPSGRHDASAVLDPDRFTGEIRKAYWIASQIPEVLNQLYCWCGCVDRGQHRSNLECFEDLMGVSCDVCRGTAEIAYELVGSGISEPAMIQAKVDEVWGRPAAAGGGRS